MDLLERLREPSNSGLACKALVLEAADEVEALRAQVGELSEMVKASATCLAETEQELEQAGAKLADALSVIKSRGHEAECPARFCASCTLSRAAHDWEITPCKTFQPYPCSAACGYSRCVGVASE